MKVLVKVPLSPFGGYGRDGIEMITAMINRGWDVYINPTMVQAPLPEHIAALFTKPLQAPFDLYIQHVDPMQLECSDEAARSSDVAIGWTMWEYTGMKGVMPEKKRKTLKKRLKKFDALVGYSDIDVDAFKKYYPEEQIIVQQGGFDAEAWPVAQNRDWSDEKIRFIQHGVLSQRKDPFRLIRAFAELSRENEAFAQGAALALHTTAPGLHSKMEEVYTNLRVFYEVWPTEMVYSFYESAHVLVAPSRGEGKNLPALEFMSTGGTVIATDFSGHQQWLDPSYAFPLECTIEPAVNDPKTDAMNARADVEHLKELLLYCFENRDEVRRKGELASRIIPVNHSWDKVLDKLMLKLPERLPEHKGERLKALDVMARSDAPRKPVGT